MKIKRGYTLIELLVVISIIGVLVTLTMVSFTQSQKQARDTKRKSDLKQYQTALEAYANKNGGFSYPLTTDMEALCTALGITGTCPEDPKAPDATYHYFSDSGGSEYLLYAVLESSAKYWVICSNGKSGENQDAPTTVDCPGSI